MEENRIRLLTADEIECRVGMISEKGLSLLLYKDARADMRILDEAFGSMNWQRTHEVIGGNLYCTVQIYDAEKKQWISKMDVGTESYTEKEKGQASDSFKRACVSVGVGRELYTAPFIWISGNRVSIQKKGDKFITNERFKIREITYNEKREIAALVIVNGDGTVVYEMKQRKGDKVTRPEFGGLTAMQQQKLKAELDRTGVELAAVLQRYQLISLEDMTMDVYLKAMDGLQRTRSRVA